MSQTTDSKKPYDGKTFLVKDVLDNANLVGKFIWNLWSGLGGSEKEFEKQQVGAKLEGAAYTTLTALDQCARRITGIASGTGNTTAQAHNKGLLWMIDPKHGKISITDLGTVAMKGWQKAVYPGEDPKINDGKALDFMAKAAEAVIKTCGYTPDELIAFEAKRE